MHERHAYSPVSNSVNDDSDMSALAKHQTRWFDPKFLFRVLIVAVSISIAGIILIAINPSTKMPGHAPVSKENDDVAYRHQHMHNINMHASMSHQPSTTKNEVVKLESTTTMRKSVLKFLASPLQLRSSAAARQQECWRVPDDEKFDCCPDKSCTQESCMARAQCCWTSAPENALLDDKRSIQLDYLKYAVKNESLLSSREIALAQEVFERMQNSSKPAVDKKDAGSNATFEFPWDLQAGVSTPWCYYSTNSEGYGLRWLNQTDYGYMGLLELPDSHQMRYEAELKQLMLYIFIETDYRVHVRIADVKGERYIPPYPELNTNQQQQSGHAADNQQRKYRVIVRQNQPFNFAIERADTNEVIFDTKLAAPLIFADQFIEFSARLSTNYVYGLGEHVDRIKHTFQWDRFIMWNSDGWPSEMLPLYGTQPFYLAVESSGNAHGVYFHNTNAMDVVLRPPNALTWRTIGGIIDLYFFMGPTPGDVVAQYTELVGRPFMPPYWSLGFHLCRYGYKSLNQTRHINSINRAAGIPVEVQWNDIDYMNKWKDFTYDHETFGELPEFVAELHADQLRYMVITDPGISAAEQPGSYTPFDAGRDADIFVKNSTGDILIGLVWTGNWTVWPDFTHPNVQQYWTRVIGDFHRNISFDGLWIDMNEPSNFGTGSKDGCPWASKYEKPPYVPPLRFPVLAGKTICMTAQQSKGLHYNLHNVYGLTESIATFNALNATLGDAAGRRRPFIVSRSNFAGSGKYSASWNGDAGASWHDLRASIVYLLNFNMFGIPMAGADICGFHSNTTVELCARWSQLGAFYTFSRNHNDIESSDQDPATMGPVVVAAARQALMMRYQLLPHFYTQLYEAHMHGSTVARPLFFEFPRDPTAKICDWQFLIGSSLLVVPVLDPNVTTVTAYLPPGDAAAAWYDLYTGEQLQGDAGGWAVLDAPLDKINLIQRGGSVLVQQQYANSTAVMRTNPFMLTVALSVNSSAAADGSLFWDAGDGYDAFGADARYNLVEFYADKRQLLSKAKHAGYAERPMPVQSIRVSGLEHAPKAVSVNGEQVDSFRWNEQTLVLEILDVDDKADLLRPLVVTYGG